MFALPRSGAVFCLADLRLLQKQAAYQGTRRALSRCYEVRAEKKCCALRTLAQAAARGVRTRHHGRAASAHPGESPNRVSCGVAERGRKFRGGT